MTARVLTIFGGQKCHLHKVIARKRLYQDILYVYIYSIYYMILMCVSMCCYFLLFRYAKYIV